MKRKVRLTESQLVNLIKKTVKKILSESQENNEMRNPEMTEGYMDDDYGMDDGDDFGFERPRFARRGSALRAASKRNPRKFPCPTCGRENKLTQQDVDRSYQCDDCADRAEGMHQW
jgi:predicted RNA-binding Zn-ribbon protein involved in translation (DUF1610 family)